MSWPFGLTQLVSGEDLHTSGAQQLFCFYHYMFQMDLDILQQMQSLLLFLSRFSDGISFFFADSTAEYMSDSPGEEIDGIVVSGLPCATVLIGVFHRETGLPVAGVINQPFSSLKQGSASSNQWSGRRLWGVSHAEHCCYFLGKEKSTPYQAERDIMSQNFKIAVSGSESEKLKKTLLSTSAKLFPISGVGHKLLHVIDGTVDFYVLSHASSFKWDTCAAHAILCSMGGGVVAYNEAMALKLATKELDKVNLEKCKIKYHKPDDNIGKKWSNINGVIAFTSYQRVFQLLESLQ